MRDYVLLKEATVNAHDGDLGFVYLGVSKGTTAAQAVRSARRDGLCQRGDEVVVVPSSAWRVAVAT